MLTQISRATTTSGRFNFRITIVPRPEGVKPITCVPSSLQAK